MAIIITTASAMQTDFAHFCLKTVVLRSLTGRELESHVPTGAPVCV